MLFIAINVLPLLTMKSTGEISEEIKPLTHDVYELSVHKGSLFWRNFFVIVPDGCTVILATPHVAHLGIIRCAWWPGNDSAIEETVTKCQHMPSYSAMSSKKNLFSHGKISYLPKAMVINPNFSHIFKRGIFNRLMFCFDLSKPRLILNNSSAY